MRFRTVIAPAVFVATLMSSVASYAWSSDGKGNIRCNDGSSATAAQRTDGTWTVTQAGAAGHSGGTFPIEGKAALYACGEG
jgi:hypothetical protein